MGSTTTQGGVRFGENFELDPQSYRLLRAGRVLKLERIPLEILLLLVDRKNQIVSREEIVARVWGKDVFLDTDNSINGAVRKIRQVLRDDSEQPRFIQTITGQGYRFIAPVLNDTPDETIVPDATVQTPLPSDNPAISPVQENQPSKAGSETLIGAVESHSSAANSSGPWGRWLFVGVAAILIAGVAGWLLRSRFTARPQPPSARLMLAVLPFENLTGDAGQEYFTDGMTEELISELGNLDPEHLGVIARTSVMHYKNSPAALDQVGRELGVQYVIEGSVRRDAERIRVTVQLIQVKDQTHLWAREYDRELKGVLAFQGEIAHEITDDTQLTLIKQKPIISVAHPSVAPPSYRAYDLYLQGQYFFNKRTASDLEQAIGLFQQSIAEDPNYARAYAGLADSYALLGSYRGQAQTEFMPKARKAAVRALELDDTLAEAHTALALIVQSYDWDWQTSEREFRRAIQLNPNYATAHHWYAEHLMWRGRFDEALQESERARQLDPLSLIIAADNGAILFYSRQCDAAIAKWRSVLAMEPGFPRAHLIVDAYVEKGMFAEALADIQNRPDVIASKMSWRTYIYGRSGQAAKAQHELVQLFDLNRRTPIDPMLVAWGYLGVGNREQALAWLTAAYAQHSPELVTLKVNPGYDPLRTDPTFQALVRKVGLAP